MPKDKGPKSKQSVEPYTKKTGKSVPESTEESTKKAGKSVPESTDESAEKLYCDRCTNTVEQLIQCEKCLIWLCSDCEKIPDNVMSIAKEYEQLHWFCKYCDVAAVEAIRAFNQTEDSLPQVIHKSIKGAFDQIVGELSKVLADETEQLQQSLAQKTQSTPSDSLSNSVQHSHADDYASRVVDEMMNIVIERAGN